jgi:thiol-disulfide isomerase/thioredoxin
VLVGKKLDNFALYTHDGKPWEFRKNRKGRVVLLDFWYSTCMPCLRSIPHLRDLQQNYGSFGLEVVGIAYEKGTPAQQEQRLRQVRLSQRINYTLLRGGGSTGTGACPVKTQFTVQAFPTLVLIDETGQIVWRSEGLDDRGLYDLTLEIRRRLGLPNR